MKKDNKTCILCGKKYSFCNRCEEYDHLPRWMAIYCSDNCRVIFNEISAYNMKLRSKEDVAKNLFNCDLSRKSEFNKQCQKCIDEILDIKDNAENTMSEDILEETQDSTSVSENKPDVVSGKVDEPQAKPKRMRNVKRR